MTVQAINNNDLRVEPERPKNPWAIISLLSLIRDVLAKGQQKIASSTEKLIENGNKIQDKQSRDLKEMGKINLEALKKEQESELIRDIAFGIAISVMVAAPILGTIATKIAATARVGSMLLRVSPMIDKIAPMLSIVSSSLFIKSEVVKIEAANKREELAEVEEHTNIDAAISDSNLEMVNFSGKTLTDAAKTRMNAQRAITEVINSTGSAMQTPVR